nr:MAG TPA: hypothetical protein [Caudoviricetes sp.]
MIRLYRGSPCHFRDQSQELPKGLLWLISLANSACSLIF